MEHPINDFFAMAQVAAHLPQVDGLRGTRARAARRAAHPPMPWRILNSGIPDGDNMDLSAARSRHRTVPVNRVQWETMTAPGLGEHLKVLRGMPSGPIVGVGVRDPRFIWVMGEGAWPEAWGG